MIRENKRLVNIRPGQNMNAPSLLVLRIKIRRAKPKTQFLLGLTGWHAMPSEGRQRTFQRNLWVSECFSIYNWVSFAGTVFPYPLAERRVLPGENVEKGEEETGRGGSGRRLRLRRSSSEEEGGDGVRRR